MPFAGGQTELGAQFEQIRMAQGEQAALAFLRGETLPEFVNPAFGVTGTLQQVFNFASRINRDRLIAQNRIEARIGRLEQGTLAAFQAVARLFR